MIHSTVSGNTLTVVNDKDNNSVLVVGCVHGDEPQGKFLIEEYLKVNRNSKLIFIPCLRFSIRHKIAGSISASTANLFSDNPLS